MLLARGAVGLVVLAAVLGVLGGLVTAVQGNAGSAPAGASGTSCTQPPCLPESLPPLSALPTALPLMLLGLAVPVGALVLLAGAAQRLRGSRRLLGTGVLLVLGPVLVVVGMELLPHLVNPCWVVEAPGLCARGEHGLDVADRFHGLAHAVLGTAPLAAAYWWGVRRWRPEALPWAGR